MVVYFQKTRRMIVGKIKNLSQYITAIAAGGTGLACWFVPLIALAIALYIVLMVMK